MAIGFHIHALALLQGFPPEPSPEMSEEAAITLGLIFIAIGLVIVIVGIWMTIDAWINYGTGWGIGTGAGCLIASSVSLGYGGCLLIIPYLIIRFIALPPQQYRERQASQSPYPSQSPLQPGSPGYNAPPVYGGGARPAPQDLELTPQEHDERIDEMLAQGKGREAMDYAQQMFKMAQDFKDTNGQARYRKYIERIRMGIK